MIEDNSKLKEKIEQALADGVLTRAENEAIKKIMDADGKRTPEEIRLWSELQELVTEGAIKMD